MKVIKKTLLKISLIGLALYLLLFFITYPPQKGYSQLIIVDSVKAISTPVDSLFKKSNNLIEDVKSEAKRGKELAKIAEKQSKKIYKDRPININEIRKGDTLYMKPNIDEPIVIQSDTSYIPVKKKTFWQKLFNKKPKYENK